MRRESTQTIEEEIAGWSLQVQIGREPEVDPVPLMEPLAGKRAATRLEAWLANGGTLLKLTTQGAPREWPAGLRQRISAAVRLVRLADRETPQPGILKGPAVAAEYLARRYLPAHHEMFGIVVMNANHEVLREKVLSRGHATGTMVPVAEVLRTAIAEASEAVVTWHNHPSGDPRPSMDDEHLWRQIETALATIEVKVVDNLVLTRPGGPWHAGSNGYWER